MSTPTVSLPAAPCGHLRVRARTISWPRPELVALLVLALVLDLWALNRNGFANDYYSAAVRSMSTSWHAFLYGSFDSAGVMTVDKPPLALWIQALSVRAFGFSSWSILVPQALMGVATVGLVYDLTLRRFGRLAGFAAGLVLALTPIAVAISRHNNPDALLVLCCTAAVWCLIRALDDGRTRWLVLAGVGGRPGLRGEDGGRPARRPGHRRGVAVGRTARARSQRCASSRSGGVAMLVVGLAWPRARVADAGGRPPVDLRHERQQRLVADPRLQRARPAVRAERRTRRRHRWPGRRRGRAVRRHPGRRCAC